MPSFLRLLAEFSSEPLEALGRILAATIARMGVDKRKDRAGAELNGQFRAIVEQNSAPIFIYDRQGIIQLWNAAAERLYGWAAEEVMGRTLYETVNSSGDLEHQALNIQQVFEGKTFHLQEWNDRDREGKQLYVLSTDFPLYGADGNVVLGVCTNIDITERKQAERALAEQQRFLRSVIDTDPNFVFVKDYDGRFVLANRALAAVYGATPEELLGKCDADFNPDRQERESFLHLDRAAIDTGQSKIIPEEPMTDSTGRTRWLQTIKTPMYTLDGKVIGLLGVATDITERIQTEKRLAVQYTTVRVLAEAMSLDEAAPQILKSICEALQWELGELWSADSRTNLLYRSHSWYDPQGLFAEFDQRSAQITFSPGEGLPGCVWDIGEPVWLSDIQKEPEFVRRQDAEQAGMHGAFAFPLRRGSQILGVLIFFSSSIRQPEAELLEMFATVGCQIGLFIERKQVEQALFAEKELAQVTLRSIGDAVITTNAVGLVRSLNPVAEELTGWHSVQAYGRPLSEVFAIVNETTHHPVENPVERALRDGSIVGLANHTLLIARDGQERAINDSAAPIRAEDGQVIGAVLVFRDVTHERRSSQQLAWQASHDSLTGLVNRYAFEQHLHDALEGAKRDGSQHTLCYLDLDQFKLVNDSCTHVAGDALLREITALLHSQIRSTDTLARLGGDEFGLLLSCPLDRAIAIVENLRKSVEDFRFTWQDQSFALGVSIGMAAIDVQTQSVAGALSAADTACFAAKDAGRNRVSIYRADDEEVQHRKGQMHWVQRLNEALEQDHFRLYCQPIVPVHSRADCEHYEVLLRLQDPQGNLVSPMAFIPAAERYDLMDKLDRWVVRTLFSTQAEYFRASWECCQQQGGERLYAVNLSGASINDERFADFLFEQFEIHKIPPQVICFEITETVAIRNLTKASGFIHDLKALGCRFALDDFGSGMSSFSYLRSLPVDYLKIDGRFIKDIVTDPIDYAIVRSINETAHLMDIKTIAEFVENDAILDKLRDLGIDYAQGYGIARPRPL